ncbi:MAG: hypothetical protein M1834_004713 [Cirrosporium novae-zelandiae]|nr:MAG: hypothetical protein M1834_004713 [Cirrosporium novae-zelandiae]
MPPTSLMWKFYSNKCAYQRSYNITPLNLLPLTTFTRSQKITLPTSRSVTTTATTTKTELTSTARPLSNGKFKPDSSRPANRDHNYQPKSKKISQVDWNPRLISKALKLGTKPRTAYNIVRSAHDAQRSLKDPQGFILAMGSNFPVLAFGVVFARLRKFKVEPHRDLLVFALERACASRSDTVPTDYLLGYLRRNRYRLSAKEFISILRKLNKNVENINKPEEQAFLRAATGWYCDGLPSSEESRTACLEEHLEHMPRSKLFWLCQRYFTTLLGKLNANSAIYSRWKAEFASMEMLDSTTLSSHEVDFQMYSGICVMLLLKNGQPKLAWTILEKLKEINMDVFRTFPPDLRDELLDQGSQYITVWDENTKNAMGRRMGNLLRQIENELHIEWVGGDIGYHRQKPFWSRQKETEME